MPDIFEISKKDLEQDEPYRLNNVLRLLSARITTLENSGVAVTAPTATGAGGATIYDTHTLRLTNYPPANYIGRLYVETDRYNVVYLARYNGPTAAWVYLTGTMVDIAANRPADLGTDDAHFWFLASNTKVLSQWSGAAWGNIVHASTHQHGGTDEVAVAAATANGIPKAGASGRLAVGWLPETINLYAAFTNTPGANHLIRFYSEATKSWWGIRLNTGAHICFDNSTDEGVTWAQAGYINNTTGKINQAWLGTLTDTKALMRNGDVLGDATAASLPTHASRHQNGGSDEVATATAAANAIPKADATGELAPEWLPRRELEGVCDADLTLTDPAYQDVSGTSLTLDKEGTWEISAQVNMSVGGGGVVLAELVTNDGSDHTAAGTLPFTNPSATDTCILTQGRSWTYATASTTDTARIQGKKTGAATCKILKDNTSLRAMWLHD